MFFKPNIKKLQSKYDIKGIGKLLRDKNSSVRQESAQALLDLLVSDKFRSNHDMHELIAFQFKGIDDKDIVSIFVQKVPRLLIVDSVRQPYTEYICLIICLAGGFDELIELHQRNADSGLSYIKSWHSL